MTPPTPHEIALVQSLAGHFARRDLPHIDCLPLIRAHVATNADAICPHVVRGYEGTQYCVLAETTVIAIRKQLADLKKERAELAAWRESTMAVEREWDIQAVGKLLEVGLGESVRRNIEPKIRELIEWKKKVLSAESSEGKW